MQKRVAPAPWRFSPSRARRLRRATPRAPDPSLGVMRRLRAIFAVLGAASGLDGEKARKLHLAVRMMQAMHGARPVHKLEKRQAEKIDNLFAAISCRRPRRPGRSRPGAREAAFLACDRLSDFQGFGHGRGLRLLLYGAFANTGSWWEAKAATKPGSASASATDCCRVYGHRPPATPAPSRSAAAAS